MGYSPVVLDGNGSNSFSIILLVEQKKQFGNKWKEAQRLITRILNSVASSRLTAA